MLVPKRDPRGCRHRMVHPWLDAETYSGLANAAERRGEHIDQFAAKLITRVVADKLYTAVLDDED